MTWRRIKDTTWRMAQKINCWVTHLALQIMKWGMILRKNLGAHQWKTPWCLWRLWVRDNLKMPWRYIYTESLRKSEGQLFGTVHNSWHTMKQTSLLSKKSQTEIKHRSLPPSEVEDYSLNTIQELPFFQPSAEQKLEAHIKRSQRGWLGAFPLGSLNLFYL